ncbi:hypothetical protein [Pseudomonas multiresinivorans]|uniref:Uncharacterized protein n=1 Tax=Pseudomonas multiresinivorans TaxID=95301 RepID=A0A7Z3BLU5_9PSED|nr:hypothetical protein [Pseudomonas multiresinivorans]QJP09220.1 hypothetical protein G4G71_15520 [Pseudomonas multiresinivorans]QJP09223.1 hypothetical protein G4G71_15535 [Pseudomonas multiresinivorans]HEP7884178.1 hypothetical protein [Pseudomonas aeruginosa]
MATANSTETLVFSGWSTLSTRGRQCDQPEKISSSVSIENALSLIGKTVLVELVWPDDPEPLWCCVRIAGAVLALEGVYEHPHFMVFSLARPQTYPDEMFWSDIRTLRVLKDRAG